MEVKESLRKPLDLTCIFLLIYTYFTNFHMPHFVPLCGWVRVCLLALCGIHLSMSFQKL